MPWPGTSPRRRCAWPVRAHYCDCLAELGRPEPPHKLPKDFGPVRQALARQLTRDMAEGLAVDPAALGILTAMERTARGTGAGMPVGGLRDFRLAAALPQGMDKPPQHDFPKRT